MINQDRACEECDLACIACCLDAACTLVTEHAAVASGVTLVGVPNCGETRAAVQRAERMWPVEIALHPQPNRPQAIDLEIHLWPAPAFSPARPPLFQRSLADGLWAWMRHTLRRPALQLDGAVR
jgi:hypothetical protein